MFGHFNLVIYLQDITNQTSGLILSAFLIIVVITIVASNNRKNKELAQARAPYLTALAQLKANPEDASLRHRTLELGKAYINLTRKKSELRLFDEIMLMSDINAACAGAAFLYHHLFFGESDMTEPLTIINPASWPAPRGYSNGVLVPAGGKQLFIAGQIGWNEKAHIVGADFAEQFDQALANVLAIITEAGGTPERLARLVIYVTDKNEYRAALHELGRLWRARMGKHYPAMTLVEVKSLLEDDAKVEIEGIAVI